MSWHLQQINGGVGPTVQGEYVACPQAPTGSGVPPFVCTFGNQQHFAYLDKINRLQDCWYDGDTNRWSVQQITGSGGAYPNAPTPMGTAFLCVFGNQLHYTYRDVNYNLQDCVYDGDTKQWNPQQWNPQITGAGGACPHAPVVSDLDTVFVCAFGNQLHFTYLDQNFNLQDCVYDGDTKQWNLQQINEGRGPTVQGESVACQNAPTVGGGSTLFVCSFNNQLHFTYLDENLQNLQDCWYDGDEDQWKLQQINEGGGPTVQGEYVACKKAPSVENAALSVCTFANQQHFTYVDGESNIQDCWYDGDANQWKLQQINGGVKPTVQGEYVACPKAPAIGKYEVLFVCTSITAGSAAISASLGAQHFSYLDTNQNLQDCWYDGSLDRWDVQQITGANGACTQAPPINEWSSLFVCQFGDQLHYTYLDDNDNLQDLFWAEIPGDIPIRGKGIRFP